jgi:hypothetical protein
MNGHDVVWTQPPALVSGQSTAPLMRASRHVFGRPAILRFTTDSFMDDFMNLLATAPERLREYHVRRETWRGFTPAPSVEAPKRSSALLERLGVFARSAGRAATAVLPEIADRVPAGTALKLYQPAHQRHYLVASSLVCKVTGLPDRTVDSSNGEKTGCLVRRLLPQPGDTTTPVAQWDEHAWISGPTGASWQKVGLDANRVVDGEEVLPLFAVRYAEQADRSRRLFAGVVPVGRREAYLGAPQSTGQATPGFTSRTSRKILLRKQVIEPWKALARRAQDVRRTLVGPFRPGEEAPKDADKAAKLKIEREQIQTASWFVLLDFAKYLETYLKPVWRALIDPSAQTLTLPQQSVVDALQSAAMSTTLRERIRRSNELTSVGSALFALDDVPASVADALGKFGAPPDGIDPVLEQQLENGDQPYNRYDTSGNAWPAFLFPLADPDLPDDAPLPTGLSLPALTADESSEMSLDEIPPPNDPLAALDTLAVLIVRALQDDEADPAPQPAVPTAAIAPANALEGWFVMRCAYERPACAPVRQAVVSEATEPFQMAGFFDPDAPARPIRIGLPIDTTPAGLRKFDKNTAFVISDTLCGQINRMKGMTFGDLVLSVLPWPLHKDLPGGDSGPCNIGMICSLSIPIITLCALFLLMIMIALLDLIFRWMPFFIICFPVPGLKAKKK